MPLAMGEPGVKFVDRGIPASRATRAERWLGIIQREIEDKLAKGFALDIPSARGPVERVQQTGLSC
jgi:hypothetical protein